MITVKPAQFIDVTYVKYMKCRDKHLQELIRRWASERELLRSAPGRYANSLKYRKITAITPFKVIQGHRFWYQSKAHIRFPISD